jgi:hypothetical protein
MIAWVIKFKASRDKSGYPIVSSSECAKAVTSLLACPIILIKTGSFAFLS